MWLIRRSTKDAKLREELESHLGDEAAQRSAAGSAADEARFAALRELGKLGLTEANTRAEWGF